SGGPSAKTADYFVDLDLHQHMRQLVRTYCALGQTFEEAGDIEKGWACHRANLQCSTHNEHSGIAICALISIACRAISGERIVHWASNPAVSAERLRATRAEIVQQYARRIPFSKVEKAEYLAYAKSLNDSRLLDDFYPAWKINGPFAKPVNIAKGL